MPRRAGDTNDRMRGLVRQLHFPALLLCVSGAAALAGRVASGGWAARRTADAPRPAIAAARDAADAPAPVVFAVDASLPILNASIAVHLLLRFGRDVRVRRDAGESASVLALLTDGELGRRWLGAPAFVATADGVDFPTQSAVFDGEGADQSHQDQCLATFAALGVPIDAPLALDGRTFTLRDALQETTRRFHRRQRDLEWSTLALAGYLAPQREWTNRFGERFDFDGLAAELLGRPWSGATCGGVHRLTAARALLAADARAPILAAATRGRLRDLLQKAASCVAASQQADGSFRLDWCRALAPDADWSAAERGDSTEARLIATGHLAEFLLGDPTAPRWREEIARAVQWLDAALRAAPPEREWREFCPRTHARCAVERFAAQQHAASAAGHASAEDESDAAMGAASPDSKEIVR